MDRRRPATHTSALTARQTEVIGLIARGNTNKEIAAALGITERGVSAHASRLYAKFGVANRAGLIGRVVAEAGFGLPKHRRRPPSRIGLQAHIALEPEGEFAVYRHAPFLVTITKGRDHRYRFVNDAATRVAGISPQGMLGRPARQVFKRGKEWATLWDRAIRTRRATFAEGLSARWKGDDGRWHEAVFDFVYHPLIDADGRIVGLLHVGTESR